MSQKAINPQNIEELPRVGLLTRAQFQRFTGYKSRDSLRRQIENGSFPAGYAISPNLRVWRAEDIHLWIEQRFPRQEFKNRKVRA